ncbi:helix-turn-helix domain-containing protein [Burkholderia multivorans]|uniref:helix-turn-helix domain-containing protein n=2 Tax=Burkholderia multivorans TaxID=87883 RepID=UPI002158AE83|nr:helix-turn-helix domain-containing protein [Burkholderia multivorans]
MMKHSCHIYWTIGAVLPKTSGTMVKTTLPTFPGRLKQLESLGERLRLARLRRKLTATLFAERMGVSRETLRRLEHGDPTIAIGTYLRALRVLGLEKDIDTVARDDEIGRKLQDLDLPQPKRRRR